MSEQSYKHHGRFDPKFHFLLIPILAALLIVGISVCVHNRHHLPFLYIYLVMVVLAMLLLALIARMYALRNQDRIIRLAESVRIRALGGNPTGLSTDQCVGLRFASDAEVVELAERAKREKLDRKQIKQAVQNWRPDHERI